jgi:hypothetical protein
MALAVAAPRPEFCSGSQPCENNLSNVVNALGGAAHFFSAGVMHDRAFRSSILAA